LLTIFSGRWISLVDLEQNTKPIAMRQRIKVSGRIIFLVISSSIIVGQTFLSDHSGL
jgi:hypothetical protein